MGRIRLVGILCAFAMLLSAGSTVWQVRQDQERTCANRLAIIRAFDFYTESLIAVGEGTERTPAEQAQRDELIVEFRADVATRLAPLKAGCS